MNEDYNFLKLKLLFLEALDEAREDIGDNLYQADTFVLNEKYGIETEDSENLIKRIDNEGALKIILEEILKDEYIGYPIKRYKFTFNNEKFKTLLKDTREKLFSGQQDGKEEDRNEFFSLSTGTGLIKNKRFKLLKGSNPFKLFHSLCVNNNMLSRNDVIKIMGLPLDEKNRTTNTMDINTEIKQIRKTTGLNENELVLNGGDVVLVYKIRIKEI